MKPSERITALAEAFAAREGELLRKPPESYWVRAVLDYLDEQHDEATWQQLSSHRPSALVEWRRDGEIQKGFFVYSSSVCAAAWVGYWYSDNREGVPVDTRQDDQWRYVEEA